MNLKFGVICALLVSCFAVSPCYANTTTAIETAQKQEMILVSKSKLKALESLLEEQELKINLLSDMLMLPKQELMEQKRLIKELGISLQSAQISLSQSDLIISEQNSSLEKLSQEFQQEQRNKRRAERQRLLWQCIAGIVVVRSLK